MVDGGGGGDGGGCCWWWVGNTRVFLTKYIIAQQHMTHLASAMSAFCLFISIKTEVSPQRFWSVNLFGIFVF